MNPDQRNDSVLLLTLAVLVTLGTLWYFGISAATFILAVVLAGIAGLAARQVTKSDPSTWLANVLFLGFLAKLVGAAVREYVSIVVYQERADAVFYYLGAVVNVNSWRDFVIPSIQRRGAGTNFLEQVTSFLFIPYVPDLLGGFMIFATIAYIGQLMLYAAFRKVAPVAAHKKYAIALFFLPSLVYWPASIGKDAIVLFALGLAAWGTASLFKGEGRVGLLPLLAGLALAAAIRPHIAALFLGAAVVALVVSSTEMVNIGPFARILLIGIMGLALAFASVRLTAYYGVQLNPESLEGFASELQRRTTQGGSALSGRPVATLADVPEASIRVLYRPLINEANNFQVLLSAVEGTVLLGVTIVALPRIVFNLWRARRNQFVVLSLAYTFGFVVAFSTVFNFGILARQRVQVLPFLLLWLVILRLPGDQLTDADHPVEPPPPAFQPEPLVAGRLR